ncbi:Imm52 family immunity protein [Pseudomonas sp. LT1P18]|uniref:Imm52 family immunity protein n=1 Tax=Pseudomonas arabinosi TaxID=3398357 RepID=UPI0039F100E7
MTNFKSFIFTLRFNKQAITSLPLEKQIEKAAEFLRQAGSISPLLANWHLQGKSLKDSLSTDISTNTQALIDNVKHAHDPELPDLIEFSVWNAIQDPLEGGVAFHYSAHNFDSVSAMSFEDAGALLMKCDAPQEMFTRIIGMAVNIWPEIDWVTVVPANYFRKGRAFKDRQTIGWIGFCPESLKKEDFPLAQKLVPVPDRGTIIVSCPEVMSDQSLDHFERVGNIDTKLVALGYLPLFLN